MPSILDNKTQSYKYLWRSNVKIKCH